MAVYLFTDWSVGPAAFFNVPSLWEVGACLCVPHPGGMCETLLTLAEHLEELEEGRDLREQELAKSLSTLRDIFPSEVSLEDRRSEHPQRFTFGGPTPERRYGEPLLNFSNL